MVRDVGQELLRQLCADLRALWTEAGGPSLRTLSGRVRRSKSQVGNILNGEIRQPPDWDVVRDLITAFARYAREHDRSGRLSLSTGVEEYWRPRYAVVEHAFGAGRTSIRAAAPAEPAAGPPRPRQLPAAVRHFAGRTTELAALTDLVKATEENGGTVVISAIQGTAGVGKTALAVHWAHRAAEWFPDGQLYVNLRGFDPSAPPMDPAEALRGFLDALRVPAERVPATVDAQARLYRSMLADRRMLVVLDNARDAEQVRPLLPGVQRCMVLITSRSQLGSLVAVEGAHPVTVGLLPAAEAWDLLARRLGTDRVAAEPEAVAEIVDRCARLPLALAVVAARAATHPDFPLAALADELRTVHDGLDGFAGADQISDVRAVFSWSYRGVSPPAARMFRSLGLHPGPDAGVRAMAALVGVPAPEARRNAAELAQAHLISEHAPGRFAMHDLLRAYAAELAEKVDGDLDRRAARGRLLDYYLHTGHTAARLLDPHRSEISPPPAAPGVTPDGIVSVAEALAWFRAEHRTLTAAIDLAATRGFDRHAWQIAWVVGGFLHRCGHWQDHATVQSVALDAAVRAGDRVGEAFARSGLGQAYGQLTRYEEGYASLRFALRLYEELGDCAGRAHAHIGLSWILEHLGRPDEALHQGELALDLYRRIGHRAGEARALNVVGWRLTQLGEYQQALGHCEQAVPLLEELGDRYALAAAWDTLGYAHHHLGDYAQATACYQNAIELCREASDRYDEAVILTHLGDTHLAAGALASAREAWARGLEILTELGHRDAAQVSAKLRTTHP